MVPKHLLRQDITIFGTDGTTDDYGQTTGASSTPVKARVEFVNKTMTVQDGSAGEGSVIVVSAKIWVAPDVSVAENARIDYDGQSYRVQRIVKVPDATGRNRLLQLECSEWRG